jgi:hypothetical protein
VEQVRRLKHNFLHLVQAHDVGLPIIELGRARALMRGHLPGLIQIPAIGEVDHDLGCPERVAANVGLNPGGPAGTAEKNHFRETAAGGTRRAWRIIRAPPRFAGFIERCAFRPYV